MLHCAAKLTYSESVCVRIVEPWNKHSLFLMKVGSKCCISSGFCCVHHWASRFMIANDTGWIIQIGIWFVLPWVTIGGRSWFFFFCDFGYPLKLAHSGLVDPRHEPIGYSSGRQVRCFTQLQFPRPHPSLLLSENLLSEKRLQMGHSDYVIREGKRYDKQLIQLIDKMIKAGATCFGKQDAKTFWECALDGDKLTERERETLRYILNKYPFDDAGKKYLVDLVDPPPSSKGYYVTIDGNQLQRVLWDEAMRLTQVSQEIVATCIPNGSCSHCYFSQILVWKLHTCLMNLPNTLNSCFDRHSLWIAGRGIGSGRGQGSMENCDRRWRCDLEMREIDVDYSSEKEARIC